MAIIAAFLLRQLEHPAHQQPLRSRFTLHQFLLKAVPPCSHSRAPGLVPSICCLCSKLGPFPPDMKTLYE